MRPSASVKILVLIRWEPSYASPSGILTPHQVPRPKEKLGSLPLYDFDVEVRAVVPTGPRTFPFL